MNSCISFLLIASLARYLYVSHSLLPSIQVLLHTAEPNSLSTHLLTRPGLLSDRVPLVKRGRPGGAEARHLHTQVCPDCRESQPLQLVHLPPPLPQPQLGRPVRHSPLPGSRIYSTVCLRSGLSWFWLNYWMNGRPASTPPTSSTFPFPSR